MGEWYAYQKMHLCYTQVTQPDPLELRSCPLTPLAPAFVPQAVAVVVGIEEIGRTPIGPRFIDRPVAVIVVVVAVLRSVGVLIGVTVVARRSILCGNNDV